VERRVKAETTTNAGGGLEIKSVGLIMVQKGKKGELLFIFLDFFLDFFFFLRFSSSFLLCFSKQRVVVDLSCCCCSLLRSLSLSSLSPSLSPSLSVCVCVCRWSLTFSRRYRARTCPTGLPRLPIRRLSPGSVSPVRRINLYGW
jgi:hypothetical protein